MPLVRKPGQRNIPRPWTRRRFLSTAATALPVTAAASMFGCGDDDDDDGGSDTAPQDSEPTAAPTSGRIASARPGELIPLAEDTFFTTTGQKQGGTIKYNTLYPGFTAEPNRAVQGDYVFARQVYQPLWYLHGSSGAMILVVADQAEEIDELTFTARVRANTNFHPIEPVNGRAVTPEDVVYSYERALADTGSTFPATLSFLEKVEAVDDQTVRFTTTIPYSPRFEQSSVQIVAREFIEAVGEESHRRAIGTGPYMLEGTYDPTTRMDLVRHPSFMLPDRPFPEKMEFQSITDQAAQMAAFRSGQADHIAAGLPKQIAESLAAESGVVLNKETSFSRTYLSIKSEAPPFTDQRIRQAISLGIDRQELIDKIDLGEGAAIGVMNRAIPWVLPQQEIDEFHNVENFEENLAEAKRLFETAGGSDLPELELVYPNDHQARSNAGVLIAQMLRQVGFNIKENALPTTSVVRDRFLPRDFQLLILGEETDPPAYFLSLSAGPDVPGSRWGVPFDEEIDEAVLAFLQAFESEQRVETAREAQRVIMRTYHNQLGLWSGETYNVYKSHLKDFRPVPVPSNYHQYDYWLES